MNIRAITYFLDASFPLSEERLRVAGAATARARTSDSNRIRTDMRSPPKGVLPR